MPAKKTFKDLVDDAKRRINEVDVDELTAMMEAREQPRPVVIDVREADERAKGYIRGSIFIPRGILERDLEKLAYRGNATDDDLTRPVVVYCAGGARAALAADTLRQMGFTNPYSLEGGFKAWGESGQPVAHDRSA